jgi:hypothetical protein
MTEKRAKKLSGGAFTGSFVCSALFQNGRLNHTGGCVEELAEVRHRKYKRRRGSCQYRVHPGKKRLGA